MARTFGTMLGTTLRAPLLVLALVALVAGQRSSARAEDPPPPPPDWEEYFKLGNDYYAGKLYDKAIEGYEKCVELKADYKEAWYNLGLAYARRQHYKKEIDAYK